MSHLKSFLFLFSILSVGSCDNSSSPDLSKVTSENQLYYVKIFQSCDQNIYDCNCVSRANVTHRTNAYNQFNLEFENSIKPKLDKTVHDLEEKLKTNITRASDVRVIDAIRLELEFAITERDQSMPSLDTYEVSPVNYDQLLSCLVK
jgi:hypothetical protein